MIRMMKATTIILAIYLDEVTPPKFLSDIQPLGKGWNLGPP
jgi:hypothetical protein